MSEITEAGESAETSFPKTKKRKIGRPKTFPNDSTTAAETHLDVTSQDTATDRRVGRMSLR